MNQELPLIVGAGPVGLGAALFLALHGRRTRIVETREGPSQHSKALAVNPRTLDLLESTGVTEKLIDRGLPIRGVRFHRREDVFETMKFEKIHPRYPFMLAISQATTEQLLEQALEEAGGKVEYGRKVVECRAQPNGIEAMLESAAGGSRETVHSPWLLAADGAHSLVREQLDIDFAGTSFDKEWHLADAPIKTELPPDHAHVFFLAGGELLFLIRVVDDIREDPLHDPVWRVMGNRPAPLTRLVRAEPTGPTEWSSHFLISHRISSTLANEGVYFAGDSAHIHSPIGARGMNLGLEDAWVFSELASTDHLSQYNELRYTIDERVVRQVEFLSRMAAAVSWSYRFLRTFVFPLAIKIPFLRSRMRTTITGLDHELPRIDQGKSNVTS